MLRETSWASKVWETSGTSGYSLSTDDIDIVGNKNVIWGDLHSLAVIDDRVFVNSPEEAMRAVAAIIIATQLKNSRQEDGRSR